MKLPITDQFLWDIFNTTSDTEDALRFLIHPPRTWRDVFWDTDSPIYQKYYKTLNPRQFSKLVYWLKKNNYIRSKNLESKRAFTLTRDGVYKAMKAGMKIGNIKHPKRKDDKWIMVMFDVPKEQNRKRAILRSVLQNLGYKMLQKSVWVSEYDVYEKTEMHLQFYFLDGYVKMFLIESLS